MKISSTSSAFAIRSGVATLILATAFSGCKSTPVTPDNAALGASVQSQIAGDSSLSGQTIQTNVQGGVVTLSGNVLNDAQRTIAARDAAGVTGVKEVVNNLSVLPPSTVTVATPPAAPIPVPVQKTSAIVAPLRPDPRTDREAARNHQPAPVVRQYPDRQTSNLPQQTYNPPPQPQAAPAQPALRMVNVPSGSTIPVRVTQTLDSATTQEGQTFSGTVASDILVDGLVAIPAGSGVQGHVDAVQEAAHFKGSSLLTVSLTGITRKGERIQVSSEPYTVEGKGRGKNTAEKVGGGAAVGAILGGIFGGGKGAAIGAAAGGGLGAGANGISRGQQVQIASESVVRFRLTTPISVRVRTDGTEPTQNYRTPDNGDPTLQRRPN